MAVEKFSFELTGTPAGISEAEEEMGSFRGGDSFLQEGEVSAEENTRGDLDRLVGNFGRVV